MITLRAKHICGILLIVLLVNDTACLALDVLHLIGSYSEVRLLVHKWPSGGFVLKKKKEVAIPHKHGLETVFSAGAHGRYSPAVCKY